MCQPQEFWRPLCDRSLSRLNRETHFSTEVIIADLRGDLSPASHSRVASHIGDCQECAGVRERVKELLTLESELGKRRIGSQSPPLLEARIKSKARLAAMLNANMPRLMKAVEWFLQNKLPRAMDVVPTERSQSSTHRNAPPPEYFHIAGCLPVFWATAVPPVIVGHEVDQYGEPIGSNLADFVDLLHDLLMERCNDMKGMERELAGCVDRAATMLGLVTLDEQTRERLTEGLLKILSQEPVKDGAKRRRTAE